MSIYLFDLFTTSPKKETYLVGECSKSFFLLRTLVFQKAFVYILSILRVLLSRRDDSRLSENISQLFIR